MANQLFDQGGRNAFLVGSANWTGGSWVPYFVGSMNAGLLATAALLSDIPAAVFRARGTYLTARTATSGIADAADTMVAAVGSAGAATAVAIMLVREGADPVASTSCLVVGYIDTASVLPFLPNGGDVNIVWDDGANKIFKL